MRIHIDPHLSIGTMPCSRKPPQFEATILVKGTFVLVPGGVAAWAETPDQVGPDRPVDGDPALGLHYPTDFAPFKPRADVLVTGAAFAPGGRPVTSLFAVVRVGAWKKTLKVTGDRTWQARGLGAKSAGEPAPFVRLPLNWTDAYGGPDDPRNPIGTGRASERVPNIEDLAKPVVSPKEGAPAGFGPIDASWQPRRSLLGTYSGNYMKERWPWFPSDFDWAYFNAAPRDQQLEGYLRGDEDLEFQNLHPTIPVLRSKLPGWRVRCFLNERLPGGSLRYRELPLVLDTLWTDLETLKLILIWRGVAEVRTYKFRELEDVQIVVEPMKERPKGATEYQALLMPAVPVAAAVVPAAPEVDAVKVEFDQAMAELERQMGEMERDVAAIEAEAERVLAAQKPHLAIPREPLNTPASEIDAAIAAAMAALSSRFPGEAAKLPPVPPNELAQFEAEMQALEQELAATEAEFAAASRRWTRQTVAAVAARGESLAQQDLSGLDLSQLDLSRSDLHGAMLAKANLAGAKLAGGRLAKADLTEANLAQTDLSRAILDGADLTGATLAGAVLREVSIAKTTLAGLDLSGADLSGAHGKEADFHGAKLPRTNFLAARLPQADFRDANLEKARFTNAELPSAMMHGVQAAEANFEGADIRGLQGTDGADFTAANFRQAKADGALFDKAVLNRADFSRARLTRAQFDEASLCGAKFDRAELVKATFEDAILTKAILTNANLLRASFERADLTDADLQGANGYDAGFWLAATTNANLRQANLKNTLLR